MSKKTKMAAGIGLLLKSAMAGCLLAECLLGTFSQTCLAESSPGWSGATVKITDLLEPYTNYGRYFAGQASVMTSNGCHVAKAEGSFLEGYFVRRDGKPGRRYLTVGVPVFSQDGKGLAYVAGKDGSKIVVVNEQEDPPFRIISDETLALSSEGKHRAYIAWQEGNWVLVIDGQVQPAGGLAVWNVKPVFSPDGSKVACMAGNSQTHKFCAVVNGKPGDFHDGVDGRFLKFSDDGAHFVYPASEGASWFRVVDGKRGPIFDGIGIDFVFSSDGKRTAYTGRNGQDWFLVVDGKIESKIEGIVDGTLTFSPDGKRLACAVAKADRSAYMLVDGKAGPVHDGIGGSFITGVSPNQASTRTAFGLGASGSVLFSPDSQHLAYLAHSAQSKRVYVDGKAEGVEMEFLVGGMVFSEDSKHLAYGGRQGDKFFLVVDGKKEADYDGLGYFEFSHDGKHIAFTAKKGDKMVIVVDGKERATYAAVPAGPVFRADETLEFLYTDEKSLYRAEVTGL